MKSVVPGVSMKAPQFKVDMAICSDLLELVVYTIRVTNGPTDTLRTQTRCFSRFANKCLVCILLSFVSEPGKPKFSISEGASFCIFVVFCIRWHFVGYC